jgi:hypothetical protein
VELNDWILALHLLAAFAVVGSEVIFGAMIATLWRENSTIRVWLAISKDPYELWDAWIIIALVLWAIAGGTGTRAGIAYGTAGMEARKLAEEGTNTSREVAETFGPSQAFKLHIVSNVAIVLLVIDMIWKPWA